jgi:hypothetical protein
VCQALERSPIRSDDVRIERIRRRDEPIVVLAHPARVRGAGGAHTAAPMRDP